MGAQSDFWSDFRDLYKQQADKMTDKSLRFAIDACVILYILSRTLLNWRLFVVDPQNDDEYWAVIRAWADAMEAFIKNIIPIDEPEQKDRITWFFEGRVEKARRLNDCGRSEGALNRAVKNFLKLSSTTTIYETKRKKRVAAKLGRPDWVDTAHIAVELRRRGYRVSAQEDTESDHRISAWAKHHTSEKKTSIVLSIDADYLTMSPPESVFAMLTPAKGGWKLIKRDDVLAKSGLSCFQLFLAFALAGTDNIKTHFDGIGWHKSKNYIASKITARRDNPVKFCKSKSPLPYLSKRKGVDKQGIKQFQTDAAKKLGQFSWSDKDPPWKDVDILLPQRRSEKHFERQAFETDENGKLVRPGTARLYASRYFISDANYALLQSLPELPPTERKHPKLKRGHVPVNTVEIPIINNPKFFPQWFAILNNSDMEDYQQSKINESNCKLLQTMDSSELADTAVSGKYPYTE